MPPLLPLVTRSRAGTVEASHSGAFSIVDAQGQSRAGYADDKGRLPRSAIKLMHTLAFIESGAAAGFSDREIALAAASHLSEPEQIGVLTAWISRLGVKPEDILCGADLPLVRGGRGLMRPPEPGLLTNNNLGKHLAIIATIQHLREDVRGYGAPDHPAMQRLFAITAELCDSDVGVENYIVDNCGLPTVPLPLAALARGMARLADPTGLSPARQAAIAGLLNALSAEHRLFGGTHALVGQIIRHTEGRIIAKGGSEGIFVALDRKNGLGYALKITDGSSQAASAAIVELLAYAGSLSADEATRLRAETAYWDHRFAPERSQSIAFPLLATLQAQGRWLPT